MKLVFCTGNKGKLEESKAILSSYEIEGTPLEINEIQSLDSVKVAVQKGKDYFSQLNVPLFVEDLSLTLDFINPLPGPYIDSFMKAIGNQGIINILEGKDNRKAFASTLIVYIDIEGQEHVFEGRVDGSISTEERGTNGFGWDTIFIPEGESKTFAEMTMEEKNKYSMRTIALNKFREWLENN